jgi:hypothetical protein
MIIRVVHDKENPYVQISRAVLEDERLSWEARGVLAYLLAKPDNWTIQTEDLKRKGKCGKARILSILAELQEVGYLERNRFQNESGLWRWERHIYESPELNPRFLQNSPQPGFPAMDQPAMVEPSTGKRDIYKRRIKNQPISKKEKTKQKKETRPRGPAVVFLPEAEHQLALYDRFYPGCKNNLKIFQQELLATMTNLEDCEAAIRYAAGNGFRAQSIDKIVNQVFKNREWERNETSKFSQSANRRETSAERDLRNRLEVERQLRSRPN